MCLSSSPAMSDVLGFYSTTAFRIFRAFPFPSRGWLIGVLRRSQSKFSSQPLFLFHLKLPFEAWREAEHAKRGARGVNDHNNKHHRVNA